MKTEREDKRLKDDKTGLNNVSNRKGQKRCMRCLIFLPNSVPSDYSNAMKIIQLTQRFMF